MPKPNQVPAIMDMEFGDKSYNVVTLVTLMKKRAGLKKEEDDIKLRKDDLNEDIKNVMAILDIPTARQPGIGTVTVKTQQRRTFSEQRVREAMAEKGVEVGKIPEIIEKAAKTSISTSVVFREEKNGA